MDNKGNNFNTNVDLERGEEITYISGDGSGKTYEQYVQEGKFLEPIAVRKDGSEIIALKLSDGTIVSRSFAVQLCKAGLIPSCDVGESKYGEDYLRSRNDGDPSNNLSNLPMF